MRARVSNFFFNFYLFIYSFTAAPGPRLHARALSICGKRGPLFIAVRGPLTIAASPVAEHRLQTRRLSRCGSRAQPLRGMRDPPRPGLEPASATPAGRLSTTAPPGKPSNSFFCKRLGRKYFTLCGPYGLLQLLNSVVLAQKQPQKICR